MREEHLPVAASAREGAPPPPRIGLSPLDKLAARAFAVGEPEEIDALVDLIRDSASALAGPDREASRLRLLSREIAICKSSVDLLTAALGAQINSPSDAAVMRLDRLLTSATKRLAILLAEHRATCALERRPAVVNVGVAQQVVVGAVEE